MLLPPPPRVAGLALILSANETRKNLRNTVIVLSGTIAVVSKTSPPNLPNQYSFAACGGKMIGVQDHFRSI